MANSDRHLEELLAMVKARQMLNAKMELWRGDREDYWLSDDDVTAGLNEVDAQRGAAVYWPTGMSSMATKHATTSPGATAISQDDAAYLECMLKDPLIDRIVIPENDGIHWSFTIMRRNLDAKWSSHHVATKSDGTCGRSTIDQAKLLLNVPAEGWQEVVAKRVRQTGGEGAMRETLPTVAPGVKLPAVMSDIVPVAQVHHAVHTAPVDQSGFAIDEVAHAQAVSERELSPVDYILSRMASAEMTNDKDRLQLYQTQLIDTINGMDVDKAEVVRDRLLSIGEKASIQAVYSATERSSSYTP